LAFDTMVAQQQQQLQPLPLSPESATTSITSATTTTALTNNGSNSGRIRKVVASPGNVVTLKLHLEPENGFVPEPLFDTTGTIQFVLGGGNYLPGMHELVQGMAVNEHATTSLDSGWGERRADLLVTVPLHNFKSVSIEQVQVGSILNLASGLQVTVIELNMNDESVVLDANPPLAGSSYACEVTVEAVEEVPSYKFEYHDLKPSSDIESKSRHSSNSKYEVSTFALGCFWGAELAFQRVPGVVGTTVGYSQGFTENPTYDEVCTGNTHHREAVQVVFDTTVTSFPVLLQTALKLLAATAKPSSSNSSLVGMAQLFETEEEKLSPSKQYRHGVYYHTDEQRLAAEATIDLDHNIYEIELLPAKTFYTAEDPHQQYLLKGGQSARKGAKEPIRCFG
jgi:peptide-methionine (S)-S-oxide reductase